MVVRTSLAVETGINKVISPAFVVFVEHGINNLHAPFSACSTSERVFQQPHLILSIETEYPAAVRTQHGFAGNTIFATQHEPGIRFS